MFSTSDNTAWKMKRRSDLVGQPRGLWAHSTCVPGYAQRAAARKAWGRGRQEKKWFIFLKSGSLIPFYFSSTFSHKWRCKQRLSVWTQRVFELGTIMQLCKAFYCSFLVLYSYVKKYNSNVPTYVRIWFHSDSRVSVRKFSIPCCESWLLVSYIWERKYRAFEMV